MPLFLFNSFFWPVQKAVCGGLASLLVSSSRRLKALSRRRSALTRLVMAEMHTGLASAEQCVIMNGAETLRVPLVTLEHWLRVCKSYVSQGEGIPRGRGGGTHPNWDRMQDPPPPPTPPSHLLHSHAAVTFHPVFPSGVLQLPSFSHTQSADLRCEDQEGELHTLTLEFEQN